MTTEEKITQLLLAARDELARERDEEGLRLATQAQQLAQAHPQLSDLLRFQVLLIFGEAALAIGDIDTAEKSLTQAHWNALKTQGTVGADHRAQLHRSLAAVYLARGLTAEALTHMAEDIYHASLASGNDSIAVALAYFPMASLFIDRLQDYSRGLTYARQSVAVWFAHLQSHFEPEKVAWQDLEPYERTAGRRILFQLRQMLSDGEAPEYDITFAVAADLCQAALALQFNDLGLAQEHLKLAEVQLASAHAASPLDLPVSQLQEMRDLLAGIIQTQQA
ncbi:uncharacterized protein MONBRDRAFT_34740 [Monosiga brevicollis MX1]|uniref:KIF-binding protein n=1 Tax=Monosiga brevicollis TaxID=81824 RepID=A9VDQ0_MONBE|nr:uncharacterized protein MONBRDRAFT_34740 [Monosiga brevicollis MX1]EDQ84359.1 predicted protein [Monosiga brevicollis MX1]|eukprot:XP_001750855.1 hypothetical protein [Monosiga brevicollis MX1]